MGNRTNEKSQRRPRLKGLERSVSEVDIADLGAGEKAERQIASQYPDTERIDKAILRLDEAVHRSTVLMEKVAAAVEVVNELSQRPGRLKERFDVGERLVEADPRTASAAGRIRRILRVGKPVSRRVLGIRSDD